MTRSHPIRLSLVLLLAACAPSVRPGPPPSVERPAAVDFCPPRADLFTPVGAPSIDLYCIEMIPTPDLQGQVEGVVQLTPPPSPFGLSVTPRGNQRWRTTFFLRGLPRPDSLGDYSTYIAWAAAPDMSRLVKLGTVRDGRVEGGELAFNTFYLLVSAERADTVSERRGTLVLRGLSASTRMRDPHFLTLGIPPSGPTAHDHAAMADPGAAASPVVPPAEWTMPPANPLVSMPPMGTEHLVPSTDAFLPGAGMDRESIPFARPRTLVDVADGDTISLTAGLVRRALKDLDVVMYGFNGQYPGPLLRVTREATIVVDFTNETPHESAVHWHGIRLDNRYDGVPHVTQEPVAPGESFRYVVHFPDAGIYWYHAHHREDVQQDLGLYGNLLVLSDDPEYFGPANREEVLMLDDLLLDENGIAPYGADRANFAAMGRFGNVFLVNGEPSYALEVSQGEVVRFHLTNASNVRAFNLSFGDNPMKVIASDVGRFEREEWVESVVLAPAERYVIDVRFERPGVTALTNHVQAIDHMMAVFVEMVDTLGMVTTTGTPAAPDHAASFATLRRHADVTAEIDRYREHFDRPADFELELVLEDIGIPYEVWRLMRLDSLYFHPVEWAGTMAMMDWIPTTDEVRWALRDARTGAENGDIDWKFRVGDIVRLDLKNERHSLHAMQHPIHIHGQRFLVLSVNGVPVENHVWKDTVLVPVGMEVQLLLEVTNPGRWMIHCHIAEHLEAGMQLVFEVEE